MTTELASRKAAWSDENYQQQLSRQRQRALRSACLVARTADEFRGRETIVLDLTEITPIFDYFVITTGINSRQMMAVCEEVRMALKRAGFGNAVAEGVENSPWILQDYGDVVFHVFTPEARQLYDLEHLWGDARRVDWQAEVAQQTTAKS